MLGNTWSGVRTTLAYLLRQPRHNLLCHCKQRHPGSESIEAAFVGERCPWGRRVTKQSYPIGMLESYLVRTSSNLCWMLNSKKGASPMPNRQDMPKQTCNWKRWSRLATRKLWGFRRRKPSNTSRQLVSSVTALHAIPAGPASQPCSLRATKRFYAAAIPSVPWGLVYIVLVWRGRHCMHRASCPCFKVHLCCYFQYSFCSATLPRAFVFAMPSPSKVTGSKHHDLLNFWIPCFFSHDLT